MFTVPQTANSTAVIPATASANNFLTGISSGGVISSAQPSLSGLSGVSISSPSDAQVLIYNSGTTNWTNKSLSGAVTITDAGVATVNNVATTPSTSTSTFYPTFVALDTAANQSVDTSVNLSYIPSSGTLVTNIINANNVTKNTTTTTGSGQTINLTGSSTRVQVVNGSTVTFALPDATTLSSGWVYEFNNNASGNITVNNFTGSMITTAIPGSYLEVILLSNLTSSGTWDYHWLVPSGVSWEHQV